jgi:hypothetical protein
MYAASSQTIPMAGAPVSRRVARMRRRWRLLVEGMTIGYNAIGHAFTYIGIVPLSLLLGEIVLGWFLLTRRDAVNFALFSKRKSRPIELVRFTMVIFLLYGVVTFLNGIVRQLPLFPMVQCSAFNYYALYLLLGIWVGVNNRPFMKQWAIALAWVQAIYGIVWLLYLNRIDYPIPGAPWVQLFSQPMGDAIAILALLSFEPRIAKVAFLCVANFFVLIGVQVRAEWLAFLLATGIWAVLSKRLTQFSSFLGIVIVLLCVGWFFDVRLPGAQGRGGEISVQGIVGRLWATFDPGGAAKYLDVSDSESVNGTVKWREDWWHAILVSIDSGDAATFFLGHGYGYPIADLSNVGGPIRTPHSIFFFALGYGGWCGVLTFFSFQLALFYSLWRVFRITGQPFGVVFWVYELTVAHFGNYMEAPTGAIPFYLIVGICMAPLFEDPVTRAQKQQMILEQDMPRQPPRARSQPSFGPIAAPPGARPMLPGADVPRTARRPMVWH